ncbi:hypothetical protein QQF64_007116 [Cirrhinus molitorella]|uniref:Uncharacterized protein n=2 Tax=Cirrhinus molitorella TaxID=172907 RepID=A0AA88TVB8_9TELE|nr:hypothetical protein Q8A67_013611 [Cirrhinus molitorella]
MGVWTVCLSLCLLFAMNASACETGWQQFGRNCFKFFSNPMPWMDAELQCLSYGGNLASVHSHNENAFIKLTISKKTLWIGGYDAVSEGMWLWSDGTKMKFKLWRAKEPNNLGGKENCLTMNAGTPGKWNDEECTDKFPFVCSIPA